jgi:hypothetical protein
MAHPDLDFVITDQVKVHVDLGRRRAVILCETDDGKSIKLEVGYNTINKIHDEIRNQMEIR